MKPTVAVIALIALLRVEGACTSDLELAPKFLPIVRFSEDTGRWGDILVTRPEQVGFMGPQSANAPRNQAFVDSGRANGSQAILDSLSKTKGLMEAVNRVASKLGSGALIGTFSGLTFTYLGPKARGGDVLGLNEVYSAVYNWWIGYTIGAAVGVTAVDPHDRFIMSFAGSIVGAAVGTLPGDVIWGDYWRDYSPLFPLFISPLVGATIGSELWRQSPEDSRITIGLKPDWRGCTFAVVSWHL